MNVLGSGGMCGRGRYLKWEDLLLEEKTGNDKEIELDCLPELRIKKKECDKQ